MKTSVKKILQISVLSIFLIFIVTYALFRSKDLIVGIRIKNVNIVDGSKVNNPIVEVRGNAKNAIDLTLNGRVISVDEDGNFRETIALVSGYNIINIKARDKFDDVDEKNYKLIY